MREIFNSPRNTTLFHFSLLQLMRWEDFAFPPYKLTPLWTDLIVNLARYRATHTLAGINYFQSIVGCAHLRTKGWLSCKIR